MKLRFYCLLLMTILLGVLSTQHSYGQLLEDRNKLKTEKTNKKGFSLYKKKVIKRAPSGQTQADDKTVSPKFSRRGEEGKSVKTITPRYSRRGREKGIRSINPRYSSDNAGNVSGRVVSPKYSRRGKRGKVQVISPKYSIDVAGQGTDKAVNPKYSRQNAGQGADRIVNPKYSKYNPGQGSDRIVSPKYSRENAGQGADRVVNPKYSRYAAGSGSDRAVSPRSSKERAGQGADRVVNPRYSKYAAGSGSDKAVSPRFSVNPLYIYKYVLPKTASGSMVFEFPKVEHYKNRKKNHGEEAWNGPWIKIVSHKRSDISNFSGNVKIKTGLIEDYKEKTQKKKLSNYTGHTAKQRKGSKMHPSANYLFAKYNKNRTARDVMQKASILWVRVHMNQTDPKGVKKKSPKLKYDKDEAEIWNNEAREYTKN
jgi:hypothetical protein